MSLEGCDVGLPVMSACFERRRKDGEGVRLSSVRRDTNGGGIKTEGGCSHPLEGKRHDGRG